LRREVVYTIFSVRLINLSAHPGGPVDTFQEAIEKMYELTGGLPEEFDPSVVVEREQIVDGEGQVVFSCSNPEDALILHQIRELPNGFFDIEIIKPVTQNE